MSKKKLEVQTVELPGGLLVLEPNKKNVHVRSNDDMEGLPTVAVLLNDNGTIDIQLRSDRVVTIVTLDS